MKDKSKNIKEAYDRIADRLSGDVSYTVKHIEKKKALNIVAEELGIEEVE